MNLPESSTLLPAATEAARIATLWWWMLGGAVVVWLIMVTLTFLAIFGKRRSNLPRITAWAVIGGGVLFPTVTLTVLLCFGLAMLPPLLAEAPAGSLTIRVHGIQWWWRVHYPALEIDGQAYAPFELANEIVIPVDGVTQFILTSEDVIHAFWVPALAGKVDMIPGRETRLVVHPYRTGLFRGICAEYCGDSHTYMNFDLRIVTREEFNRWVVLQQSGEVPPTTELAQQGRSAFLQHGCGACHTVRGTIAQGRVGPELTHLGSRRTLAAGMFERTPSNLAAWIKHPDRLKPGAEMPPFDMLDEHTVLALAAYLEQLR